MNQRSITFWTAMLVGTLLAGSVGQFVGHAAGSVSTAWTQRTDVAGEGADVYGIYERSAAH